MSRNATCLAMVEIGPAALRLVVAEAGGPEPLRRLNLYRCPADWARDVLVRGRIGEPSIRSMLDVLRGFGRVIGDHAVDPHMVRASVFEPMRMAENAAEFRERLTAETGISAKILRPADERRLARLAIRRLLDRRPDLAGRDLVALHIGWGHTFWMASRGGHGLASGTCDLGALRLRLEMEARRTPGAALRSITHQCIDPAVEKVHRDCPALADPVIVALSVPARLAADRLRPGWREAGPIALEIESLATLARRISVLPVSRIVRMLPAGAAEAAIAGPGMLAYVHLARAFGAEEITVPRDTAGDLLLAEAAACFERPERRERAEQVFAASLWGRLFGRITLPFRPTRRPAANHRQAAPSADETA